MDRNAKGRNGERLSPSFREPVAKRHWSFLLRRSLQILPMGQICNVWERHFNIYSPIPHEEPFLLLYISVQCCPCLKNPSPSLFSERREISSRKSSRERFLTSMRRNSFPRAPRSWDSHENLFRTTSFAPSFRILFPCERGGRYLSLMSSLPKLGTTRAILTIKRAM